MNDGRSDVGRPSRFTEVQLVVQADGRERLERGEDARDDILWAERILRRVPDLDPTARSAYRGLADRAHAVLDPLLATIRSDEFAAIAHPGAAEVAELRLTTDKTWRAIGSKLGMSERWCRMRYDDAARALDELERGRRDDGADDGTE